MLFLTGPLFLFKGNSALLPGTGVIVWDRLESALVNILFTTKLLSLDPLERWIVSWPCDHHHPCSLGNSYCTFGFLIFIIDERNFLYYSLYILTEKSLKHLCSIRAWVHVSFFLSFLLSLSLSGWFLGVQRPVLLTLLPRLLRRRPVPSPSSRQSPVPLWEMQVLCQGLYWFSA